MPLAAPVEAFRRTVAGDLAGDFPRRVDISLSWLALALALAVRDSRLVDS